MSEDTATEESPSLLVDASVCIRLAEIDAFDLLESLAGRVVIPPTVRSEVDGQPASDRLDAAISDGWVAVAEASSDGIDTATTHLGSDADSEDFGGDVALLACALDRSYAVVLTDDKPLRKTCKALSIPVSGSIGILVRAAERGDLDTDEATAKLYGMDEVGARLSASLVRRAERLIEDASDN